MQVRRLNIHELLPARKSSPDKQGTAPYCAPRKLAPARNSEVAPQIFITQPLKLRLLVGSVPAANVFPNYPGLCPTRCPASIAELGPVNFPTEPGIILKKPAP